MRRACRIARGDAAVAAILGQTENAAVGEPGELGGELVTFACRGGDRSSRSRSQMPRDDPSNRPDMVHIGNDTLGHLPATGAINAIPPGDMLTTWQGLAPIRQHVAPEQIDLHALESPAFLAQR